MSLTQVKLASGRTAYANAQPPTLPSSIAPYVQGVLGLDNVNPDQPAGLQRRTGPVVAARLHSRTRRRLRSRPTAVRSRAAATARDVSETAV